MGSTVLCMSVCLSNSGLGERHEVWEAGRGRHQVPRAGRRPGISRGAAGALVGVGRVWQERSEEGRKALSLSPPREAPIQECISPSEASLQWVQGSRKWTGVRSCAERHRGPQGTGPESSASLLLGVGDTSLRADHEWASEGRTAGSSGMCESLDGMSLLSFRRDAGHPGAPLECRPVAVCPFHTLSGSPSARIDVASERLLSRGQLTSP